MNDEQLNALYRELIASYGEKTMEALDHLSRKGGGITQLIARIGNEGQSIEESAQAPMGVIVFVGQGAMTRLNALAGDLFEKCSPDNVSVSSHVIDPRNHDHG